MPTRTVGDNTLLWMVSFLQVTRLLAVGAEPLHAGLQRRQVNLLHDHERLRGARCSGIFQAPACQRTYVGGYDPQMACQVIDKGYRR